MVTKKYSTNLYDETDFSDLDVNINHSRDDKLTPFGKTTLKNLYCLPGEKYQEAFARAAKAFSNGDEELAQRLYDYASNLWFSFATPLLSNGGTDRGLSISCFLNYVQDSINGLTANFKENAFLSVKGGGIGTYWGAVRSLGEKTSKGIETPGVIPFIHVQDAQTLAYQQGSTRRGSAAVYLDISHPEIVEFINMRSTTGGDVHRKNENIHHGICITDAFMEAVDNNRDWQLVDPTSRKVHSIIKARDLWIKILQQRVKLGEPYLFFVDTANRSLPSPLKDKGLRIHHSNLCTEITLPTSPDRTAVCCLSSINISKIDEWWENRHQFIEDLVTMLDNALEVFVSKAPSEMWRAVESVKKERSIGLGTLGFHTYLQFKGIPLDSDEARKFNKETYAEIKKCAVFASKKLAHERGEPDDISGSGLRHAHLLAIAPNASSSIICGGVSPSIEPMAYNAFTQKTITGSHEVKNPALIKRLKELGYNNEDTWTSIILNGGSVQHLDFLSDYDKSVFLTASEIDPMVLVKLAAERQPYICQAQSLNLFFPANVTTKKLHQAHFNAWKLGLKSLYYLRSTSVKTTGVGNISTQPPPKEEKRITEEKVPLGCSLDDDECKACEG